MKMNEFLNESEVHDIEEAPAGMIGQMARKAGAKVLNKIGMKGTAANMATKADVGAEANRIKQELNQFMAGSGIKKGQLEVNDFLAFLGNAGFDKKTAMQAIRKYHKKQAPEQNPATLVASIEESVLAEAIPPATIDKVIMDLIKLGFKKQAGGKQARSKYAMNKPGDANAVKSAMQTLKKAGYKVSK